MLTHFSYLNCGTLDKSITELDWHPEPGFAHMHTCATVDSPLGPHRRPQGPGLVLASSYPIHIHIHLEVGDVGESSSNQLGHVHWPPLVYFKPDRDGAGESPSLLLQSYGSLKMDLSATWAHSGQGPGSAVPINPSKLKDHRSYGICTRPQHKGAVCPTLT